MTGRIEVNPSVMQGKPVVRNTRIPVELLLRKLAEGAAVEELLDAYPRLTREDIQACLAMREDGCRPHLPCRLERATLWSGYSPRPSPSLMQVDRADQSVGCGPGICLGL